MIGWIHDDKHFSTCLAGSNRLLKGLSLSFSPPIRVSNFAFNSLSLSRLDDDDDDASLAASCLPHGEKRLYRMSFFWLFKLPSLSHLTIFFYKYTTRCEKISDGCTSLCCRSLISLQSQSTSPLLLLLLLLHHFLFKVLALGCCCFW